MLTAVLASASLILPPVGGAYNAAVTPATVGTTICVSGYSSRVRPPLSYTAPLKRRLIAEHHLPGTTSDYQLDHMISLSVGGDPRDLRNLWMEPIAQATKADRLEARWHRRICDGSWGLRYTQRVEARFKRDHG